MTVTRYGTCPGIRSGENEVQAWQRQVAYYGDQRVHRVFFPYTLMGQENPSARSARQIIQEMNPDEDLVVSCKDVGPEFPARVAELKALRKGKGRTRIIIHHEPEGDLTIAAYNAKWDTALPTLEAEADWLEPGTCHTGFWSRKVDAEGMRENDWRDWIPENPEVRALLRFVSADLYPSAGQPTKAKPAYYEPPGPHTSGPYGGDIGFCGILDEMLAELRGDLWPDVPEDLEGGIAEINHQRPDASWPTPFASSDENGAENAEWVDVVFQYADGRYAFVTWFHKGGGDLMLRTPPLEAEVLREWIRDTYDREEEQPTETPEEAYERGRVDGTAAERLRIMNLLQGPLAEHSDSVTVMGQKLEALGNAVSAI